MILTLVSYGYYMNPLFIFLNQSNADGYQTGFGVDLIDKGKTILLGLNLLGKDKNNKRFSFF